MLRQEKHIAALFPAQKCVKVDEKAPENAQHQQHRTTRDAQLSFGIVNCNQRNAIESTTSTATTKPNEKERNLLTDKHQKKRLVNGTLRMARV